MVQTILIYIGMFFGCFIAGRYAERYNSKKGVVGVILILVIIAGFRGETVGIDTGNYIKIFNSILSIPVTGYLVDVEASFKIICTILLKIWDNYQFLFCVFALITNACIVVRLWDFRKTISFPWAVIFYVCSFYFLSLNIMRQMCAVAIVFWATRYLKEGRYLLFSIFVIMGNLFHSSAVLGFAYLLLELFRWPHLSEKRKKLLISLLFIGVLFSMYLLNSIALKYEHYFERPKEYEGLGLYLTVKLIFFICSSFFIIKETNKSILSSTKLYYFIGFILSTIGFFYPFMNRIGLYHMIYESVYMGLLVKKSTDNSLFKLLAVLLFGAAWIYSFLQDGNGCVPYLFVWQ